MSRRHAWPLVLLFAAGLTGLSVLQGGQARIVAGSVVDWLNENVSGITVRRFVFERGVFWSSATLDLVARAGDRSYRVRSRHRIGHGAGAVVAAMWSGPRWLPSAVHVRSHIAVHPAGSGRAPDDETGVSLDGTAVLAVDGSLRAGVMHERGAGEVVVRARRRQEGSRPCRGALPALQDHVVEGELRIDRALLAGFLRARLVAELRQEAEVGPSRQPLIDRLVERRIEGLVKLGLLTAQGDELLTRLSLACDAVRVGGREMVLGGADPKTGSR